MSTNLQSTSIANGHHIATEDSTWWDQNREAVEAKFIGMLMAETTRKPYSGPERRSRATTMLDPADIAIAQAQAKGLGISYEEHARRLFHRAVMAEAHGRML
jgi:hypothetical protein